MLGIPYTTAIDMWSFGCILVELHTGNPIFPGENEVEQMQLIMAALGEPPEKLLLQASRKPLFFHSSNRPRLQPNS
jgi:dual specificity tyrosine-phosphorylation-regulated kinase 2/3/4